VSPAGGIPEVLVSIERLKAEKRRASSGCKKKGAERGEEAQRTKKSEGGEGRPR